MSTGTLPFQIRSVTTLLLGICLAVSGCGQKAAETTAKPTKEATNKVTQEKPEAEPAAKTPKEVPAAAPAEPARTYTLRIVPGAAKAGVEATSMVEITPLPGYKMNKDFPSRLKLDPKENLAMAKTVLTKKDADISEALLRFKVPFTAAKAGSVGLSGNADFSVCNESTCKLYRGEQVIWEVAVQ